MSKNKGKDKKNDATVLIQKQFEAQKRDIIDYEYTVKKLQQRLAEKISENEELQKQLEQVRFLDKQEISILTQRTVEDEVRLTINFKRITELDLEMAKLQGQIKLLKQELSLEKQARLKEVGELKIRMETEKKNLNKEIENLKVFDREKCQQQILDLKDQIEYERTQKQRELADKEREKVQATDKLRDEMLKKIRQMRTNLLSLKKQQLSTTTRLTILQNHQLTSELQYQSKQTEKLIFKEEEMNTSIKQMSQQLSIHKQVEEELAKRAHFSKGVIKKLNQRVAELEKQLELSKNSRAIESGKNISYNQTSGIKSKIFIEAPDEGNGRELLAQVEKQLSSTEKKYSEAQSKLQATEKERESLANQVKRYENSCNELAKVLITYSEQILTKKTCEVDKTDTELVDPVLRVDLDLLRTRKVEDWTLDQTSLVVKILLNLIKPYLSKKNIMIPAIRRLLVVEDSKLDKSQPKLPKIMNEIDENSVKGLKDLPTNIASKIVGSNLREWGNTVSLNQNALLKKKYKITQSHR